MRLAIASTDGKTVNQHFGRTPIFLIIEIDECYQSRFLEARDNTPACASGEHDDQALARSVELLSDCQALFVLRVGNHARILLERTGMEVLEVADYFIDTAIEGYIKHRKRKEARAYGIR